MVMHTPDGRQIDPPEETLEEGSTLFRVHSHRFRPAEFNPGPTTAAVKSRFAFFGNGPIPVLYAAGTPEGAISETILHDVDIQGGRIDVDLVQTKILSQITTQRSLRLLSLHGYGFRQVGALAEEVARTGAYDYAKSVRWAEAAFEAGFDGISWMSRHHDTSQAYVFFQRPGAGDMFGENAKNNRVRVFAIPQDLDWLTRQLAPLNVTITES